MMVEPYHLNKSGGGGIAGGFTIRNTPIFPHLSRRYVEPHLFDNSGGGGGGGGGGGPPPPPPTTHPQSGAA
jgi:hypothetical protein